MSNLFTTPAARSTDPATSHAAARSVRATRTETQRKVLALLRQSGPCTDEELHRRYERMHGPISTSGLRTRRRELCDAKPALVKNSGKTRRLSSGRRAIVWEVV